MLRNHNMVALLFGRKKVEKVNEIDKLKKEFYAITLNIRKEHEAEIAEVRSDMSTEIWKLRTGIAMAFLNSDHKPTWTTNIAEELTCGFGECDSNGFFDFEVPTESMKWKKTMEHERLHQRKFEMSLNYESVPVDFRNVPVGSKFYTVGFQTTTDRIDIWEKLEGGEMYQIKRNAKKVDTKEIFEFVDDAVVYIREKKQK